MDDNSIFELNEHLISLKAVIEQAPTAQQREVALRLCGAILKAYIDGYKEGMDSAQAIVGPAWQGMEDLAERMIASGDAGSIAEKMTEQMFKEGPRLARASGFVSGHGDFLGNDVDPEFSNPSKHLFISGFVESVIKTMMVQLHPDGGLD